MADPQSNAALPAHPSPERQSPPPTPELPPDAPRAGVLHVRHRHTERYTVVGNHLAQHPRLSATAIGIGVYIQSLPDGASVTIKALTLRFPEGEVTIGRALRELEEAGYLVRRRVPLGGGRIATRTFFLDHPGAVVRASVRGGGSRAAVPAMAVAMAGPERELPPAPGPVAAPAAAVEEAVEETVGVSAPTLVRTRSAAPKPVTAPTAPAVDLLARLRLADTRLLLSEREVQRLLPAVETWLARGATPDQITRTLTAGLPSEAVPIRHPASFVEYRLTTLLPPPLPTAPLRTATATAPAAQRAPLVTCDGCERAIRTHDPRALCRECRERHDRRKAKAGHSAA
ncbi:helix-turn-helix domain-containing protein [Streptomyces sp. A012304]|uniref:helix-turn-helix domain-containing protein n=1 Tax=Streptomyces sp. A012304 TaxID=375446 RepID=UPI00222E60DB|nr:helix-turn-helix domain-containing protein [Streptomyces sp. A012304]